jgi:hypothetical protein
MYQRRGQIIVSKYARHKRLLLTPQCIRPTVLPSEDAGTINPMMVIELPKSGWKHIVSVQAYASSYRRPRWEERIHDCSTDPVRPFWNAETTMRVTANHLISASMLSHRPAATWPWVRWLQKDFISQKIDRRRDRTCNLLIRSQAPCHWASRPISWSVFHQQTTSCLKNCPGSRPGFAHSQAQSPLDSNVRAGFTESGRRAC